MAKVTLETVTTGFGSAELINRNFQAIASALETLLSRDGTSPNGMAADVDMDMNRIYNLPSPSTSSEPITRGYWESQVQTAEIGLMTAGNVSVADESNKFTGENAEAVLTELAVVDEGLATDIADVAADLVAYEAEALNKFIQKEILTDNSVLVAHQMYNAFNLEMAASTVLGRKSTGNIDDITMPDLRTELGLGTVYQYDVGTAAYGIVQLDGSSKLPAVDGSALTNLPGLSTAYESTSGTAYTGGNKSYTWTHGLGVIPKVVVFHAKCVNAAGDIGYALNDVIVLHHGEQYDTSNSANTRGWTLKLTTTTATMICTVEALSILALNGSTRALTSLGTTSDWELYCYAYA